MSQANQHQPTIVVFFDDDVSPVARKAIISVLEKEGVMYVDDPDDKGRATKFGITKRWYPNEDIKNLTIERAAQIYYEKYWLKNNCHQLPLVLALILFDCAVNIGGLFARKTLQEALNVKIDGDIGPKTLGTALTAECTPNAILDTVLQFTRIRCRHYTNLAQADYSQIKYIEGWVDRALDVVLTSLKQADELGGSHEY